MRNVELLIYYRCIKLIGTKIARLIGKSLSSYACLCEPVYITYAMQYFRKMLAEKCRPLVIGMIHVPSLPG